MLFTSIVFRNYFQECQSHPQAVESQMALRSAAENLVTVTSEATSEQQSRRIMEHLEQVNIVIFKFEMKKILF